MNTQFFGFVIIILVALFLSELYKVNNRVKCRFTRRDKSIKTKWAKLRQGERIECDGGWYYVITSRIRRDSTFFGLLPVAALEFSYKSIYPIDPETGNADAETPEARKNLDKREDIEALNVGSAKALGGGRQKLFGGGLLPIFLVVGLVACGYMLWQLIGRVDMLGQAVNILQQMQMNR